MKRHLLPLYRTFALLIALLAVSGCKVVQWQQRASHRKMMRHGIKVGQISKDGFRINFWKGGQGPVVLFLHGFGGDALTTWKDEMLAVAKNYTVIAPDLLWFGKSSFVGAPNLTNQRKAVELLLDEFNVERVTLVGQSYGGFVALDFCLNNPLKVQEVVFANCPGHTFDYGELDAVCERYGIHQIHELFVFNQPQQLQRLYDLAAYNSITVPLSLLKQSYALYFKDNGEEKKALLNTLPEERIRFDNEVKLRSPSHVIWGEYDELFSLAAGRTFAQAIDAKWHVLKNCGHAPQLDDRKAFTSLITELLMKRN